LFILLASKTKAGVEKIHCFMIALQASSLLVQHSKLI